MKMVRDVWLPDEDDHIAVEVERTGTFQTDRLEAAIALVPAGRRGLAVDIGAHVGTWTRIMAREFACVVAVEPAADSFACLVKNIVEWNLANVSLYRVAIDSSPGRCRVEDDPRRPGNTGARFVVRSKFSYGGDVVPSIRLDDLVAGLDVGLVKIDVEGAELEVLLGGGATIAAHRPVLVVELKPGFESRFGSAPADVEAHLRGLGYREALRFRADAVFVPD